MCLLTNKIRGVDKVRKIVKKSLIVLIALAAGNCFAKHYFNICYYNWTNNTIGYNNGEDSKQSNRVSKDNFKERGTVVGQGDLEPGKSKCFVAADETIFLSHKLSFIVDNQLFSIVNSGFSKPRVVSQNATGKGKGHLGNRVDKSGHDQYYLDVHVVTDNQIVLSSSADKNDTSAHIEPANK
jgi:hypothetical protein